MSKLVKDLKDDDIVYVIETDYYGNPLNNNIIECKIKIKSEDWICGDFVHKHLSGILNAGKSKFTHGNNCQVFRISTVDTNDPNTKISKTDFDKRKERPGGIEPGIYNGMIESKSFHFLWFYVFADKDDAKNYVVDWKLRELFDDLKSELKRVVKIKKYTEKK